MHLEFLVEEASAEAALRELLPRLAGEGTSFRIHAHQGKTDLLACLPGKLRGYARWLWSECLIVVLIDLDSGDCKELKTKLEQLALDAKLTTKTSCTGGRMPQVLNRIAIEELEAWFFGDVPAICAAYPRVPASLSSKRGFTDPDGITGGTWERLKQVLQRAGYFRDGFAKIKAASEIARHMEPDRNRSKSFRVFRDGLLTMLRK